MFLFEIINNKDLYTLFFFKKKLEVAIKKVVSHHTTRA